MIKIFFYNTLIIFTVIFLNSCSSKEAQNIKIKKKVSLPELYSSAYQDFEIGKYRDAVRKFEEVEKNYSYTNWAPKALLIKAYIYYDSSSYLDALAALQKFKKFYPANKDIAYAHYLTAVCLYEQINFISLSQENTVLAIKEFKKITVKYPGSSYAIDARFKIDLLKDQMAGKQMYLARYFIKKEKWAPAMHKLNIILKDYQTTIYIEEALHRLVEINYKIGNLDSAKKYAIILGYNYNNSDWFKKSYNIVENKKIPLKNKKQKKSLKAMLKKIIQLQ